MYIHTHPKSSQLYQGTLEKPAIELWMCLYLLIHQAKKRKKENIFYLSEY